MFGSMVESSNPAIVGLAKRLEGENDQATVLNVFNHVKQFNYSNEKKDEDSWKNPEQTLNDRSGDCEDFAVLIASLLGALNIPNDILVAQVEGVDVLHVLNAVSMIGSQKLLLDATEGIFAVIDVLPYEDRATLLFVEKSYLPDLYVPLLMILPLAIYRSIPI